MKNNIWIAAVALCMTLTASDAQAGNVSQKQAQGIAAKFFASHGKAGAKSAFGNQSAGCTMVSSMEEDESDPAYYIFNAEGAKSFVIVSGEDRLPSLLGYSLNGSWPADESSVPTPLKNALHNYAAYVNDIREGKAVVDDYRSRNVTTDYSGTPVVGPLLTTTWSQMYPYSMYTPEFPDTFQVMKKSPNYCAHYVTGCVAIAIAQVINYWGQKVHKPVHPADCDTYFTWDNWFHDEGNTYTNDTTLCSLSSSTIYDWANMPDSIGYRADQHPVMPEEEWEKKSKAVGQLVIDVAHAMNMSWGFPKGGSPYGATFTLGCPEVLTEYFGFSQDVYTIYTTGEGNQRKYIDLIKDNLDKGYPVIAGGSDANVGGHCFVYDGYDTNDFVHVNWGWGGNCDNFFDVAYLQTNLYNKRPDRNYNFSSGQQIVLDLYPKEDGAVEKPYIDNKYIQMESTRFVVDDSEMDGTFYMGRANNYNNKAVVYLDRDSSILSKVFSAFTYHKSFGYDYDFALNIYNLTDGTAYCDTLHDNTMKIPSRDKMGVWYDTDSLYTHEMTNGLYVFSGAMREVLNGETSPWKEVESSDTILLMDKDIVLNPSVYEQYYHGKECVHYLQDKNNHFYVHEEFTKDPDNVDPDDYLLMLLERQGTFNKNLKLDMTADEHILLTGRTDDQAVPDTLYDDTDKLGKLLKTPYIGDNGGYCAVLTPVFFYAMDDIAGKTYHLTYTIPCLGISLTNDIKVNQGTGIREVGEAAVNRDANTPTYNLAGQRVSATARGIIIQGGRKYVRK